MRFLKNTTDAINEADLGEEEIIVRYKPWLLWFWYAFLKGAGKSPVLIINGKKYSSGTVPNKDKLREYLTYLNKKDIFLREK